MKKRSLYIVLLFFILSIVVFRGIAIEKPQAVLDDIDTELIDESPNSDEEAVEEKVVFQPSYTDIDILAVGDIMFHMPQVKSANIGEGRYDFKSSFEHVKKYIEEADLSLANYETVTISDKNHSGFPRFNSPKETLEALQYAGFDILSTANNHSLDQGKAGILSTLEAIKAYGMEPVGTNMDKDSEPLIVDIKGIKIGLLSYTYGLNGLDSLLTSEELSYMINLIDEERIQEEIEGLENNGVDLIISYIHWGHEYHREPSQEQMDLGRKMVEWGVNIVFGSHPHVVQKSELVHHNGKDNLIVYSMGNFLSNQREITMGNSYTEDGVMVKVKVEKDLALNETVIKEIEYIPTWVHRYSEGGNYSYEIIPSGEALAGDLDLSLDSKVIKRIEKSYEDVTRTYKID